MKDDNKELVLWHGGQDPVADHVPSGVTMEKEKNRTGGLENQQPVYIRTPTRNVTLITTIQDIRRTLQSIIFLTPSWESSLWEKEIQSFSSKTTSDRFKIIKWRKQLLSFERARVSRSTWAHPKNGSKLILTEVQVYILSVKNIHCTTRLNSGISSGCVPISMLS